MDGLAVDAFPECGAFVVGEGIEEGFSERGVGVEVLVGLGVWDVGGVVVGRVRGWGVRTSMGAVVVAVIAAVRGGVGFYGGCGAVSVRAGSAGFGFEAEGLCGGGARWDC